ncbi:MAG: BON domain-containing protein [Lautropia sp.]|nr:BON domain-containing protein [Lautropia sp.]
MIQPSAFSRRILSTAVLAATLGLSGCFGLAVTGAAIGTVAVMDRRSIGAQTEDQTIELRGARSLNEQINRAPDAAVSVTSFNRRVLLTGQVPSEAVRIQAEETVRARVPNIKDIYNELEIKPVENFSGETRDTTLTAQVKAGMVRERHLTASAIKVVTEGSVVYLMGVVTREEGQRAAIVASQVAGVKKVVTLFEYVTDADLDRIQGTERTEEDKLEEAQDGEEGQDATVR